jgi:V/A-type H+-transporting ATPase subunit I
MARAVIAGPRDKLPSVITTLHDMKLIHIIDHHGEDDTFRLGKPLPPAAELSENLVKLRSIANILAVKTPPKKKEAVRIEELREKILTLELNITEEDAARKKAEALLNDLDRRIDELRPFAALGLPLDSYRGYETIAVIVGRIAREISEGDLEGIPTEVFHAPGIVAVFTPKSAVDQALGVLAKFGFTQLDIPAGDGNPKELLDEALADLEKWKLRLEEIQGRLETLRERYAGFVIAAEEVLEVEVDKAEAPLRFAVSDHSFVIDGWLPSARSSDLGTRFEALGIFVETEDPHGAHEAEAPPVLLRNPKPVKPFEFLVHLYSTPNYHELDPTQFLFLAAPFFFGFMIGDAGYGALFIALGIIAAVRLNRESIWWRIFMVTAIGGVWALLLGLFIFGEAFGIPFHPPPSHLEELSFESFGLSIPIQPIIHKAFGVADMIYLSLLFAAMHLGTAYIIGFVNEIHHNKKHALAKLGWFMCLFGLFTLLTFSLRWNPIALWVWDVPLGWFPRLIEPLGLSGFVGVKLPLVSLILIFGAFLGLTESVIAPIEIAGLLANIMSYTRLAGLGIGKAAIAAAFNTILFQGMIFPGQIGFVILGIVFLVMAQLLVFLLGWISAGIQALRLNYVEAFIKFYKGNGTPFRPFGMSTTQEV